MTNSPTLDLAELERLEKAATCGPWSSVFLDDAVVFIKRHGVDRPFSFDEKDPEFILTLRNAAPDLIAAAKERDELRAERDVLKIGGAKSAQSIYDAASNELASLRALLVRAGEALAPMAAMLCLVDEKDPSKGRAFDRFADEAVLFNVGKDRAITAGDLRRAFAVSASITRATQTDTTDAEAGT